MVLEEAEVWTYIGKQYEDIFLTNDSYKMFLQHVLTKCSYKLIIHLSLSQTSHHTPSNITTVAYSLQWQQKRMYHSSINGIIVELAEVAMT